LDIVAIAATHIIAEPCSKLPSRPGGISRKGFWADFYIRSLTPQSRRGGTGKALAAALQRYALSPASEQAGV